MKVIVTGGAGFIGSNIVDLLISCGYKVCVIDNLSHGKEKNINAEASFYNTDIRDKYIEDIFEKERPDFVIHNAAQISVRSSIIDPFYDASINILGTINLLEVCRKYKIKKIIYSSSAAVFGEPNYLPLDESHPTNMISNYGVTKHVAEDYLKVYNKLHGINFASLRYSNVYGPRQDPLNDGGVVSVFCYELLHNVSPQVYGDGEQARDFIYVKDVAMANLKVLQSNKTGIFNVSTSKPTTINNLVRKLNSLLDKNISPRYLNPISGDIKISYMSNNRIKNELDWVPKYSLQEGLTETISYFQKNFM